MVEKWTQWPIHLGWKTSHNSIFILTDLWLYSGKWTQPLIHLGWNTSHNSVFIQLYFPYQQRSPTESLKCDIPTGLGRALAKVRHLQKCYRVSVLWLTNTFTAFVGNAASFVENLWYVSENREHLSLKFEFFYCKLNRKNIK